MITKCWQNYAVNALQTVEWLAGELGLAERLHLRPDKSLMHERQGLGGS